MKQTITIPKFFHELLGTKQNTKELTLVIGFTVLSTMILGALTLDYWTKLQWYQSLILWLLYIDISGGVIANLTSGTNGHYANNSKARWVFIAIHVQPILLAWVLGSDIIVALLVWSYTMVTASTINILRNNTYHRTLAGLFMAISIAGFIYLDPTLPPLIAITYAFYFIKVIYSFAVNHEA